MEKIKEYAEEFYKSSQWKKCRKAFIASLADKTCPRCHERIGKIVHHKNYITPYNITNPMITLNFDNLEYLCQECHTLEHLKRGAVKNDVEFDENGNLIKRSIQRTKKEDIYLPSIIKPIDKDIYIVCGAPGSGKSTYVNQVAKRNDLIIDLDNILLEFTHEKLYSSSEKYIDKAIRKRNQYLNNLNNMDNNVVWFIVSAPKLEERRHWKEQLGGTIILIDVSKEECFERLKNDIRRTNNIMKYLIAANKWFFNFTDGYIDKRITPSQFLK